MTAPFDPPSWLTLHSLVVAVALATYVVASAARRQRRHPSAAIAWVVALALMPYVALPLFVLFGVRKTAREPRKAQAWKPAPADATFDARSQLQALAVGLGMPPALPYRDLVVHHDGQGALDRLIHLLRSARHSIDLSTFLVGNDAVGTRICGLLAERAREGVRVRLMIDGVGRYMGGAPSLQPLKHAGVQVRLFASPWTSPPLGGRANLRNHRKIAAADRDWIWTGGRNLAREYFLATPQGAKEPVPPWTDLTFDLRGPLAQQVCLQFDTDWAAAAHEHVTERTKAIEFSLPALGETMAQFLPSGPDQSDDAVHALLTDACFNSRRRILAVTPYFVPDDVLLMGLTLAARRGVQVDLVVPRRSNHLMADLVRPAALRDMAEAGARIWLTAGMVHAKLVVVDDAVAFSGSLNLDERSLFLNYEMMIAFYEPQAIGTFSQWAVELRGTAELHQPRKVGVMREFGEGLLRWLTFQV